MAPPLKYRQPLDYRMLIRFTTDIRDWINEAVLETDMTAADYVRSAVLLQLERDGVIQLPHVYPDGPEPE